MISHSIEEAIVVLKRGDLVAIPTETVYGLAADASSESAVARIYEVKGRPLDHPVIVHISGAEYLGNWAASAPSWAQLLIEAYWPGPLTLVLPRAKGVGDWVTGGQETVGLRFPNHPIALEVIRQSGLGIAAPSANRFGGVSPTSAQAVLEDLGPYLTPGRDLILDGGPCKVGVESTIVDATSVQPRILRLGAITRDDIEAITDLRVVDEGAKVRAPGTLASHYSPLAKVHLQVVDGAQGFIALSQVPTPEGLIRLAAPGDVSEYAHVLYAALRSADALGLASIVAVAPEGDGLAAAIHDRLQRAAASN